MQIQQKGTNNNQNLIEFLYGSAGYPSISTLIQAVKKGYYAKWPGLTVSRIKKYLNNHIINTKGHMHLQQQVKYKPKQPTKVDDQILNPIQEIPNIATKKIYIKIEKTGLIATDQTGKLPTTSKRAHKYLFILYSYDANAILFRPMKK